MTYLNGVNIPQMVTIQTYLGKVFSLTLSYASGIPMGPEGNSKFLFPFVLGMVEAQEVKQNRPDGSCGWYNWWACWTNTQ